MRQAPYQADHAHQTEGPRFGNRTEYGHVVEGPILARIVRGITMPGELDRRRAAGRDKA